MTDLTERLREANSDYHNPLMREAAHEIERLKEVVICLQKERRQLRDDNKTLQVALDFSVENDKIAADEIERLRAENDQLIAELNKYELAALQARTAQRKRDDY